MKFIRNPIFLICVALNSACAQWPEAGSGGAAETRLGHMLTTEADQPLTPEIGLRYDFTLLKNQLDILIMKGARVCFPAAVYQAELKKIRISRELRGGLYGDATNDILVQRQHLARLERQLDAVLKEESCVLHDEEMTLTPLFKGNQTEDSVNQKSTEWLLTLLNKDNQFATDSDDVNPKFKVHLVAAAKLLAENPQWRIQIVGYADIRGSASINQALSYARANAVASVLLEQGVNKSQLEVRARGSAAQLFQGQTPGVLLVNRSVVSELLTEKVTP